MSSPVRGQPASNVTPRPARSRNGCSSCRLSLPALTPPSREWRLIHARRRKVRCNEQKPRCSHCERLNLDCTWNRTPIQRSTSSVAQAQGTQFDCTHIPPSIGAFGFSQIGGGFNSTWDEAMLLSPSSWPDYSMAGPLPHDLLPQSLGGSWTPPTLANVISRLPTPNSSLATAQMSAQEETPVMTDTRSNQSPEGSLKSTDNEYLLEEFLQIFFPPILASVEMGPKWSTTREFFASMCSESSMVRHAVMAFSAFQLSITQTGTKFDYKPLYHSASHEIYTELHRRQLHPDEHKYLKHILAALFLLTYADLLTQNLRQAHSNLKEAYNLIRNTTKRPFTATERRLISWLRLLDARAVSTDGGEGLFLAEDDDTIIASSPASVQLSECSEAVDTEIEDILFDVIYQPGVAFYQKVQSFMGRVSKIDPWHRTRGTVEDETEVMAIGMRITHDLHALYSQRPALMDHAVAGNLTEKHLAKTLAVATTRSFRTYLANYYACFIHVHRVAYKPFPRTRDVVTAIEKIKWLCHLMDSTDDPLPVNLLWPLLMWGSEEDDLNERQWILSAIGGLEAVATNAKATASLLEKVQERQDITHERADIRKISQEIHASHFAIV